MEKRKRQNAFPLRLPRTTRMLADQLAQREGISLNQFISLAIAEKIERFGPDLPTEEHGSSPTNSRSKGS
jgi:hypothetical protein